MALVVKDRVKESASNPGTGTVTLSGAVAGFRSFGDIGSGNTTYYVIFDVANSLFEVGEGTYTDNTGGGGNRELARNEVLQNSSGNTSKINFTGSVEVFVALPASKSVHKNNTDNLELTGDFTITSGSATDQIVMKNTNTGTSAAPDLVLWRDSASPANADSLGRIDFRGEDDGSTARNYTSIESKIVNVAASTPTGAIHFKTLNASTTEADVLVLSGNTSTFSGNATFNGTVNIGTTGSLSNNSGTFLIDANTNLNFRGGTQTFDNANGSVEYMRLNSTGLGIGISPAYKFHQHENSSSENYHLFTNSTTGQGSSDGFRIGIDSNENALIWHREANSIQFATSNDQKMEIDSSGRVTISHVGTDTTLSGGQPGLQVTGSGFDGYMSAVRRDSSAFSSGIILAKSRGTTADSFSSSTKVQDNDQLGSILFIGDDGTDLDTYGAFITAEVNGTPASNNMPTDLIFATNGGSSSATERLRIGSSGKIGIGVDPTNARGGFTDLVIGQGFETGQGSTQPQIELYHSSASWAINNDSNNSNQMGFHYNNGSSWSQILALKPSGSSTFSGDIQAAGMYIGSTNTSYDFYNNGTSYLNGTVTVDERLTAQALSLNDNGVSGVILNVRTDDDGPWAFRIGNDTVGTNAGYSFYQHSNGTCNHYTYGNGSYVNTLFHTSDGSGNVTYMTADTNGSVNITPGTGNGSNDASLYVNGPNANDWGMVLNKASGDYGLDIRGTTGSYAVRVLGNSAEKFRIAWDGTTYVQNRVYADSFYDNQNSSYYVDPSSNSNLYSVNAQSYLYLGDKLYINSGGGSSSVGTAGQVLTSGGTTNPVSWQDAGGGAWEVIGNYTGTNVNSVDFLQGVNGFVWNNNAYKRIVMYGNFVGYSGRTVLVNFYPLVSSGSSGNTIPTNLVMYVDHNIESYPEFSVSLSNSNHYVYQSTANNSNGGIMFRVQCGALPTGTGAGVGSFANTIGGTYYSSAKRKLDTAVTAEWDAVGIGSTSKTFSWRVWLSHDYPSFYFYPREIHGQTLSHGWTNQGIRVAGSNTSSNFNYDLTFIGLKP